MGLGFAPRHYEGQDEKYQQGGQSHMALLSSTRVDVTMTSPKSVVMEHNGALMLGAKGLRGAGCKCTIRLPHIAQGSRSTRAA